MNNYKYNPIKMTPFKWFVLENFPFIEEDFDSLTSYGLWCKLKEYFDDVANKVNGMGTQVESLTNAFIVLKDYVDNYFKNLDVQDEINNKLDEMAEDGTLAQIIGDYALKKLDYYLIDNTITESELQNLFNIERSKIIEFKDGNYNFNTTFRLNKNTKLILNNAILNFANQHAFFNFKGDDEFLEYKGNGNIEIVGGTIKGGAFSLCHAYNIKFINVNFVDCLNNHIIELMAINNILIKGCTFRGQTNPNQRECIQVDDCNYNNFPWFDDSTNPTYDLTHCKNITVDGCIFEPSENVNFEFATAFGMHTYTTDGNRHENITLINNKIKNPTSYGFRLNNAKNVIIENNDFYSNIETHNIFLRFGYYDEDVKISKNTFQGGYRVMYFSTNPVAYINFVFNYNLIKNIDNTYGNSGLIILFNPENFKFSNNRIYNVNRAILKLNGSEIEPDDDTQSGTSKATLIISDNNIVAENLNYSCFLLYYGNTVTINNNTFNYDTTGGSAIVFYQNDIKPFIYNNVFCKELVDKNRTINMNVNKKFENVYGIPHTLYSGSSQTFNDITPDTSVFDYNTLIVVIGKTANTYSTYLLNYTPNNKLTPRTFKIPFIDDNGDLQSATITIDENGVLSGSTTTNHNMIRVIYGFNEMI